jgi:hypothetical protein
VRLFAQIEEGAAAESSLWSSSLLPVDERQLVAVFSTLVRDELALGVETVYEAYLVHYGRPRLFATPDADEAVLLGDYLYAHGLVRVAEAGGVEAVRRAASRRRARRRRCVGGRGARARGRRRRGRRGGRARAALR